MKMKREDISRLAAAVRDAGEDLFCAVGASPDLAALTGTFIPDGGPALLLTPGAFALPDAFGGEDISARFADGARFGRTAYALPDRVIAADVRLLGDAAFRAYCADAAIGHILVPFAELADLCEYGGRNAYGWIGEFRAELPFEIRVTALFSEPLPDYGPFLARFASPGCTVIDASVAPSVFAYEAADIRKKYACALALAEKRALRCAAVFFTDRREAEEFLRFLRRRGKNGLYLNGGMPAAEQKAALDAFGRGEGLLVATKSAIPYAPFYRADDAIFCGVPYSASLMARCASFSAEGELTCCFCPDDFKTDRNILRHFADGLPEEEREAYLENRLTKLAEVKSILCETDSI